MCAVKKKNELRKIMMNGGEGGRKEEYERLKGREKKEERVEKEVD